MIEIVIENQVC